MGPSHSGYRSSVAMKLVQALAGFDIPDMNRWFSTITSGQQTRAVRTECGVQLLRSRGKLPQPNSSQRPRAHLQRQKHTQRW